MFLRRILLLSVLAAASLWAQRQMSVAQLEQFIKSSIDLKQPDKQVADVLKTIRLSQRLDAREVETLQGMGVGPRTLDALRILSAASLTLAAPPVAAPPPPPAALPPAPSAKEQQAILDEVRRKALDYTASLPNFICTQVTKRLVGMPGGRNWRQADTVQEQLSFADGEEDYKVVLVNNLPVTNIGHEQVGGTTSRGEFGTRLHEVFRPESKAEIQWARWATLRGRRMHVFEFRVLQKNSDYTIFDGESGREMVGGYHGVFYADAETRNVMRIKMDVDGMEDFPIKKVSLDLNYDFIDISGRAYVLPLRAELNSDSPRYASRNEVEFRRYSRFTADASIVFDVPDEIPQDQLEEQPIR